MKAMDEQLVEAIDDHIHAALTATMREWIERYCADKDHAFTLQVTTLVARSMIMTGCTFIGNAIGLPADKGLKPGIDCVKEYARLSRELRGHLIIDDSEDDDSE